MPKNWIAFTIGPNGGPSSSNNSGLLHSQSDAEAWAIKAMAKSQVEGVFIAKIHSRAQRITSPVEFIGVADLVEVPVDEAEAA